MRFIFYSPVAFEPWDFRNSVLKGIGGSETSHVEMAWRLARRGHEVISYCPIPEDCPGEWRGTRWKRLEGVDMNLSGLWVVYRAPQFLDEFPKRSDQHVWLMMQDFDYGAQWTQARLDKIDRVLALCHSHARHVIASHPELPDLARKMWVTSNGTKIELIDETEQAGSIERNPYRIMHASSPDRGLLPLLKSFKKAREYCPDLELHAFYGFDNIDKLIDQGARHLKNNKDDILKWADQPHVHLHGRISQNALYREWLKSGIYCYETNFYETSHISGQEAQCMGAVPVFSPVWGQAENIRHGIAIPGDANEPLTQARFAAELARLAIDTKWQESIRRPMIADSRARFDWERMVDHWLCVIEGTPYPYDFPSQPKELLAFQQQHELIHA